MRCSNCSQSGHNVRTCPELQPFSIPLRYDEMSPELQPLITPTDEEMSCISLIDSYTHDDVLMGMKELVSDPPTVECMVCYEDIECEKVSLKCGHAYCVQCFIKHMRVGNNCAACRANICDPPEKLRTQTRTLSHEAINEIVENNLIHNPDFIADVHTDLCNQTKKYIKKNYVNTTEMERERLSTMMYNAIESTDVYFGFWIAGLGVAREIINAIQIE
jgi:hypothetical protein